MKNLRNISFLLLAFALFLSSCKEETEDAAPKSTLTAVAGPDQEVKTGQTVILDGSSSSDSEGKPLSYGWAFTKKPAASAATLTTGSAATASFTPDASGEYELELTLSNGTESKKDKVLVKATAVESLVLESITVKTVLEDRNADPSVPDYVVSKDFRVAAELTVKPGVVIAFAEDIAMTVVDGGVIIAKGEADRKVVFTGKAALPGYWKGIVVFSNSQLNEFSYAEINYAGSSPALHNVATAVAVYPAAKATVKNTTISHSGGYGLYLPEKSLINTFAANSFKYNAEAPVLMAADNVAKLDMATAFTGNNGRNIIEVASSSIAGTKEVTWPAFNDNTPYRLLGRVTAKTGWVLSPGVTIEVAPDQFIDIESGYIKAIGTADRKITFTGEVKTPGSWDGIVIFTKSTSNIMEHVQVSYAGANRMLGNTKASIALFGTDDASLSIKDSGISYSGGYGIHLYGRDASLNADAETSNTFTANAQGNIYKEN